jgi:hypothetical protein
MANNLLTTGTPTYNATGIRFGQSLLTGNAYVASSALITGYPLTIETVMKGVSSANVEAVVGRAALGWIGKAADNTIVAHYQGAGDVILSTSISAIDAAHHVALVVTSTGATLYVDGAQAATSTTAPVFPSDSRYFGVRAFFSTAGSTTATAFFTGEVDEVAVWNTARYTAAFTPPTTAYSGNETGLTGLYHLDGNLNDSTIAGAATAVVITAPSTSTIGVAANVTVSLNGTKATTTTVNLTSTDGTFNPTSVTVPVNGSVNATYTPASAGAKTLTATDAAAALTTGTVTTTASAPASGFDQTKVRFSPGNWLVTTGNAKSNNDGAYFRFNFTGASCQLNFDMTNNVAPNAILQYRVDNTGPWNVVTLAATITLAMPTETAPWTRHFAEVKIRQTSEAVSRWSPQSTAVVLNGIVLASGGALVALPPRRAIVAYCYGDSIKNGINAMIASGDSTVRGNAQMSYMNLIMERLGFEFGMIAFGGQGWTAIGGGAVPVFPSTWNFLWAGQARDFTTDVPDYILVNHGQNDSTTATTTQVTAVLNGMLAATPRTTKIVVLRPLSGLQAANIQTGIAACSTPSRVVYVDTTGWFNSANSLDGIHPLGWEHNDNIARVGLEALRPILQPVKGARTLRTITLTLTADAAGTVPRASLTGITGAIFDQASPELLTVAADTFTGGTTDANGLFTQTVYSTLAAGAQVWLDMASADKTMAFKGLATLT